MGLNIKNAETIRLIEELAALTGKSKTTTVTEAVRDKLDRIRRQEKSSDLAERMLEIGRDCASRLKEPYKSIDHAKLLYDDELGLPK